MFFTGNSPSAVLYKNTIEFRAVRTHSLVTFFQDIWSEGVYVTARAKDLNNPAFADLLRPEIGCS